MRPLAPEDGVKSSEGSIATASPHDPQVRLEAWPKKEYTREEYRQKCLERAREDRSLRVFNALDGVVDASSYSEILEVDPESDTPRVIEVRNFNHHGVDEDPGTPATCEQLLLRDIANEGRAKMQYVLWANGMAPEGEEVNDVNDCDPDCCLSHWYRVNRGQIGRWRSEGTDEGNARWERVQRLVELEGKVDRKGGVCRMDLSDPLVAEMAWMFEPYFSARPRVPSMDAAEMLAVVEEVCARIDRYVGGDAERRELDLRSTPVAGVIAGEETAFVDEALSGPYAKVMEVNRDKRLVVSMRKGRIPDPAWKPEPDTEPNRLLAQLLKPNSIPDTKAPLVERYFYTIVMADYEEVPLDRQPCTYSLRRVYDELNKGLPSGTQGRWNGRWNAGGCPSGEGTTQTPQEVANVIRSLRTVAVRQQDVSEVDPTRVLAEDGLGAPVRLPPRPR